MPEPQTAVIGYGFAGRCFHSYLVDITPGLALRGVCSRNAETREKIRAERGCDAYDSFEAVLADDAVDLVVIATPNRTHADLAVRALEAGKNVVTDKVMCLNLEECDRMIAAASAAGKMLTVFQNRRWDGDYLTIRKLMADGRLGDVRWMEFAWQGFGPWHGWRGSAEMGGGRFYDLGAHLVDQAVMLFPAAVERVFCRMHHDYAEQDIESHAQCTIMFADGRTAVVDTSGMAVAPKPRYYVCGDAGTFVKYGVDPQEKAMIDGDIDGAREAPENYGRLHDGKTDETIPTLPGRWRSFYENVRDVLTGATEPAVTLASVRRAIAVFDAAFRSAKSGESIRVDAPALDDA